MTQLSFRAALFDGAPIEERAEELVRLLKERGWLTRREIGELTGWDEREIRAAAEAARDAKGRPEVVRGPLGFAVFDRATDDQVRRAEEIAISQARKMFRYGVGLRRRLHERVG